MTTDENNSRYSQKGHDARKAGSSCLDTDPRSPGKTTPLRDRPGARAVFRALPFSAASRLVEKAEDVIEEETYPWYVSLIGQGGSEVRGAGIFTGIFSGRGPGGGRRQPEVNEWSPCATAHPAIWAREPTPSLFRIC